MSHTLHYADVNFLHIQITPCEGRGGC